MTRPTEHPSDPWASWGAPEPTGPTPAGPPAPWNPPPPRPPGDESTAPSMAARRGFAILAIGFFVAAVTYRYVRLGELTPWVVFFHGLPAVIALALAATETRTRGLPARVVLVTTWALLLAGTVAGEGFVCIVIAAPFIYLMVTLIALIVQAVDPRRSRNRTMAFALPVVFLASIASGVTTPEPTTVTATTMVAIDAEQVVERLATRPDVPPVDSGLLGLGFPQPVGGAGGGLTVGDRQYVEFSDGGRLTVEVVERLADSVTFEIVEDTTMIGRWIDWDTATFRWEPGPGSDADPMTTVTLDLTYRRLLQPGWYFGPIVDEGADQAVAHLLTSRLDG